MSQTYEKFRARRGEIGREKSQHGRDIGPRWPKVKCGRRRAACRRNLSLFLRTYFPGAFPYPWSPDQEECIRRLQTCALEGGLFALAMPRGAGKTSITLRTCIWAIAYGHRRFVVLLAATEPLGKKLLESIRRELCDNPKLAADFPAVCFPFRELGGSARRAGGQLIDGQRSEVLWTANWLGMAHVPQKRRGGLPDVGGSVIASYGLTGAIKGLSHTLPSGQVIRPDMVVGDDPQTRDSAGSQTQTEERAAILRGDVLGMAGPDRKIACVITITSVYPDDLADRFLDPQRAPEWQGQRGKAVLAWPDRTDLWDQYRELRAEGMRTRSGQGEALAFYRQHQADMEAGAAVAWDGFRKVGDLSTIQSLYHSRWDMGEAAFQAEFQNDPLPLIPLQPGDLSKELIFSRLNRVPRGTAPGRTVRLTAFVDVQATLLWWMVCGWQDDFTGSVIACGAWPEQRRHYYTLADASPTLETMFPRLGLEGRIYQGLSQLVGVLVGHAWPLEGGGELRTERCLVDEAWGDSTAVVRKFCRESPYSALLMPSRGRGISAAGLPMDQWTGRPGERRGFNWIIPAPKPGEPRFITYDANFWKSFLVARLNTPMGSPGALTLYGSEVAAHQLLADHLLAEYRVRTSGRGREIDEWKLRPERPDNHWLDCLAGNMVAASMCGVRLADQDAGAPQRRRVKFSEQARMARERRERAS